MKKDSSFLHLFSNWPLSSASLHLLRLAVFISPGSIHKLREDQFFSLAHRADTVGAQKPGIEALKGRGRGEVPKERKGRETIASVGVISLYLSPKLGPLPAAPPVRREGGAPARNREGNFKARGDLYQPCPYPLSRPSLSTSQFIHIRPPPRPPPFSFLSPRSAPCPPFLSPPFGCLIHFPIKKALPPAGEKAQEEDPRF